MDYEKKLREALDSDETDYEVVRWIESTFPELAESEDERIRKWLVDYFTEIGENWIHREFTCRQIVAYLEKQKELFKSGRGLYYYDGEKTTYCGYPATEENPYDFATSQQEKQKEQPKEELVYRLNGFMQEYVKEGKDEAEKEHRFKCYQLFWDALEDENFFEQKEQKHPNGCFTCDEYKKGYEAGRSNGFTAGYNKAMKEQKPVEKEITLTNFEETLNTFLFGFANSPIEDCEPKEYIKKHSTEILKAAYKELNAKLQQDIFEAKQEGIRDGYEVAKAEQEPAEWSEEDELNCNRIIRFLEPHKTFFPTKETKEEMQNWLKNRLKSLRPSWKPSEEQMEALQNAERLVRPYYPEHAKILAELYEQLKAL